jgi:hypothetical protein
MKVEQQKKSQTLISSDVLRGILDKLGYNLLDCGNHWRTNALFRNGDNPTAIQIYKNTGVWIDYTHGNNKSRPFEALLQLTLKDDKKQLQEILKSLNSEEVKDYKPKELIEMEKIYPESSLKRLFPNYHFYNQRKISEETQKFFKVGLSGSGQMYRRMVFPIYNEHSQIIGFSGRRVDEGSYSKWKHIGRKKRWIYPCHIPAEESIDQVIDESKSVYIVESIGDAMAFYEQGIKNVICIFGTSVSSYVINYLCSKDLKKIYISTNNDFDSSKNNGLIGAFQAYMKLGDFFNLDQLEIRLPPKPFNDFGKAHEEDYNLKQWQLREINTEEQTNYIFSYVKNHPSLFTKKQVQKVLKILNE